MRKQYVKSWNKYNILRLMPFTWVRNKGKPSKKGKFSFSGIIQKEERKKIVTIYNQMSLLWSSEEYIGHLHMCTYEIETAYCQRMLRFAINSAEWILIFYGFILIKVALNFQFLATVHIPCSSFLFPPPTQQNISIGSPVWLACNYEAKRSLFLALQ